MLKMKEGDSRAHYFYLEFMFLSSSNASCLFIWTGSKWGTPKCTPKRANGEGGVH